MYVHTCKYCLEREQRKSSSIRYWRGQDSELWNTVRCSTHIVFTHGQFVIHILCAHWLGVCGVCGVLGGSMQYTAFLSVLRIAFDAAAWSALSHSPWASTHIRFPKATGNCLQFVSELQCCLMQYCQLYHIRHAYLQSKADIQRSTIANTHIHTHADMHTHTHTHRQKHNRAENRRMRNGRTGSSLVTVFIEPRFPSRAW